MRNKLRGAARSITIWINGLFLAAWPFADQIMQGIRDNLPAIQPYVTESVYRYVGLAVVAFNIVQRARTKLSLDQKGAS